MLTEPIIRPVETLPLGAGPYQTVDTKIRELCNRIYYLLQRCTSPSGRSLIQILSEIDNVSSQHLFNRIYRHVRAQHVESQRLLQQKIQRQAYLIEAENELFLSEFQHLLEILGLFGLREVYREIPHYIRKRLSPKMLQALYEDIPRIRILHAHRHNPSPYRNNIVETVELMGWHYDGEPIPPFIKKILIHKVIKFQGHQIKVWELIPKDIRNPTPICLLPGFGLNYYTFHSEGNQSLDYHLVKEGSRVFVLDHEGEEEDADIDIYTEYLLSTLIEFIKVRTNLPQVILGGHSLGGTLIIFKHILETLRRPRFLSSIKAILLLNAPINFSAYYYIAPWMTKLGEFAVDTLGTRGSVPLKSPFRLASRIPGLSYLLTRSRLSEDSESREASETSPTIMNPLNPLTQNPNTLKTLMRYAVVNPPRLVLKHVLAMIQSETEGAVSYDFEKVLVSEEEEEEQPPFDDQETAQKTFGINYTEHLYRLPASVPLFVLQTMNNPFSPPSAFFRLWKKWPHQHKRRLDSYPYDYQNQQQLCDSIHQTLSEKGPSTAIGVTLHEGRHLDCLSTQKRVLSAFIHAVEELPISLARLTQTEIKNYHYLTQQAYFSTAEQHTLEQDFARKIRFLDKRLFWSERSHILELLLQVLLTYPSQHPSHEKYQDLLIRNSDTHEHEELRFNVFHCCIHSIMNFEADSEMVLTRILDLLAQAKMEVDSENFRALIDCSVVLYDHDFQQKKDISKSFLKKLEKLLKMAAKQKRSSVALHALRAFFHTRNAHFIKEGMKIYETLPKGWKEKMCYIYWDEIYKLIEELEHQHSSEILQEMSKFIEFYDQLKP